MRGGPVHLVPLLAALFVSWQDPDPETPVEWTEGDVAGDGAAPTVLARPSLDHALAYEEIATELAALAAAHPELAALETIGQSRAGREIQVLTITDPAGGAAEEKPALFLVDFGAPGRSYGAAACLGFARDVLDRAQSEPEIAELLAGHTIYLAPALDPDGEAHGDVPPRAVSFDRNFPLGWLPATLRAGSGDVPLSEPETLVTARFLNAHENLVLIAATDEPGANGSHSGVPWAGAELPEDDRGALERLCASGGDGLELFPWSVLGSPGGGLFDYAYQALGVYPVAWAGPDAPSDAADVATWVDRVALRVGELLRLLPTMRIENDGLEEIAPGLWQLDVAIRNAGSIPTLSVLGGRRQVAAHLSLSLSGARVVATAQRGAGEDTFRAARLDGEPGFALGGGVLAGGETRWLRVILEGESGTVLEVSGAAVRAGRAALTVTLP